MKDGRKNPRITPHDEEDDWDWRVDRYNIQKQIEEEETIKREVTEETLGDFMEDDNDSEEESISKEETSREESGSEEESNSKEEVVKTIAQKKTKPEVEEAKASEGLVVKTIEPKPQTKVKGPAGVKSAKGEATVVVAKDDSPDKSAGKNVVFMGGKAVLVDDNDDSFL